MPFGGNDWLALTQEETLEPGLLSATRTTTSGTSALSVCPTSAT